MHAARQLESAGDSCQQELVSKWCGSADEDLGKTKLVYVEVGVALRL